MIKILFVLRSSTCPTPDFGIFFIDLPCLEVKHSVMAEGCGSLFCRLRLITISDTPKIPDINSDSFSDFLIAVNQLFYKNRISLYLKMQVTYLLHDIQNHLQIIKPR